MIRNINIEDRVIMLSNDYVTNKEALNIMVCQKRKLRKDGINSKIFTHEPMTALALVAKRKDSIRKVYKSIKSIKKDNRRLIKEIKKLQKQMY